MTALSGTVKLEKILLEMAEKIQGELSVGFPSGDNYESGINVPTVAFWNEFGTSTAPPRPFFRPMIQEESPKWAGQMAALLKMNKYDGEKSLAMLGERIAGDLRQSIRDVDSPALSPVTLMLRKMFGNNPQEITGKAVGIAAKKVAAGEEGASGTQAKPLVWTGRLLNAPAYSVNGGSFQKVAQ